MTNVIDDELPITEYWMGQNHYRRKWSMWLQSTPTEVVKIVMLKSWKKIQQLLWLVASVIQKWKLQNVQTTNVILHDEQNKLYWVTIFNDLLQEIAKYSQNGAIPLEEQLLISPTLTYKIYHKDIVVSVAK